MAARDKQKSQKPAPATIHGVQIATPVHRTPQVYDASLFINRELSWVEFNRRVLEEAYDTRHPLLERVKFLSIFSSNLDEFFMIRVAGLKQQVAAGVSELPPDGISPAEQLEILYRELLPMLNEQRRCLHDVLLPILNQQNIHIMNYCDLNPDQQAEMREYFKHEVYPVLTPLAVDPGHPFPHISNLSLNLAVVLHDPQHIERFARIKVPSGTFPRLVPVSCDTEGQSGHKPFCFVWLEQVIAANMAILFPGMEVVESCPFRVIRNADVTIEEDEASDLLQTVAEGLRQRQFGFVVQLMLQEKVSQRITHVLMEQLQLTPSDVYEVEGPLGLSDLSELTRIDRPDLKDPPIIPHVPAVLASGEDIFKILRQQDVLLHHPYDSFVPVIDFINAAANDPQVLAIKQTLYRVGANSPIVQALMNARNKGKQVAVLVELKARFDEENNIEWARALEGAGVHVVYGLIGLKTHCKIALIVRREPDGIHRYIHLGTGNYNAVTARIYTDLSLMTSNPDIGEDATELFNFLTGYSTQRNYKKLLVAPINLRERLRAMINREATFGKDGHLIMKMNSLVDPQMIEALYAASQAGVKIDLLVRGICCLRPGVKKISETIRVTSIVGRFLEHSRIYYFRNGGSEELYLGSADLMQRNLDRRVEVLYPVEDPFLLKQVRDDILYAEMRDTANARELLPDGTWSRVHPTDDKSPFNSQLWHLTHNIVNQR